MPFPFFLAYAAALLKKQDFEVRLIDAIAEGLGENLFLTKVEDFRPDLMVVETSTVSLHDDLDFIKKIDTRIPIVLCGPDVNIQKEEFLKEHSRIAYVLCGEYEYTLSELALALKNSGGLEKIQGLNFRKANGEICVTPPRPLIGNLDNLPWPMRDGLPMDKYLDVPGEMPLPSVQIISSRGCPYGCTFCLWPQVMYGGRNYRVRSPNDVVDEMEYLVKVMKFRSIYFDDDTFGIDKKWLAAFIEELKKRNDENRINVAWAIMTRPDIITEESLAKMRSAGLCAVKYGVESANQELINRSGKNLDLKEAKRIIRLTSRLGIRPHLTFMFGLPGETRKTIRETIRFAMEMNPFTMQFSIATPFPGTAYFEELAKKGFIVSQDWAEYDGSNKAVFKMDNLSRKNLEAAKEWAYTRWRWHRFVQKQIDRIKR